MRQQLSAVLGEGPTELFYSCDTYQFSDYSKYDVNPDRAHPDVKAKRREGQFPLDLERAYEMGRSLCQ